MSKSRGNFLDPIDLVATFGTDGIRYVTLREVPFDRDADVSWDLFVRRYNADLANDFGNLVNRTVSMTNRYLDGARPAPRAADASPLGAGWASVARDSTRSGSRDASSTMPWPTLWEFVGGREQARRRRAAVGRSRRRPRPGTTRQPRGCASVLGDLLEACRLIALAAAPFMPADRAARARPARAIRIRTAATATAGRRSSTSCAGAPTRANRARRRAGAALPAARRRGTEAVEIATDRR